MTQFPFTVQLPEQVELVQVSPSKASIKSALRASRK